MRAQSGAPQGAPMLLVWIGIAVCGQLACGDRPPQPDAAGAAQAAFRERGEPSEGRARPNILWVVAATTVPSHASMLTGLLPVEHFRRSSP